MPDVDMPRPLLSIIIPHHNRIEMLKSLLLSIPSRDDIEIIVVDDHSQVAPHPDHFQDVGRNIRLLYQSEGKRGAGAARNRALQDARGEWIFFADSDDLVRTDAFNGILARLGGSDADIIHTYASSLTQDGRIGQRHLATNQVLDLGKSDQNALVQFYPPWCKFIRKAFLDRERIGFDEVMVSNDVMFSAKCFIAADRCEIWNDVSYVVREGHPSLTSTPSVPSIETRLAVMRRFNACLAAVGLDRYRVPAIGQLVKIWRKHPFAAARLALHTWAHGEPAFLTRYQVRKALLKMKRQRETAER